MKIIYFHQHFSTRSGQAGTRSYEFAKHLIQEGEDVEMICGRNQKSNFDFEAKGRCQIEDIDGISVHIINVPYAPQMGFLRRVIAFFSFAFRATYEGMKVKNPDLVFATSTPITVAFPGMVVSLFKRKPFIFEVRDIWPESAIATGVLKNKIIIKAAEWFERLTYRRAHRLIALSSRMKDGMVRGTGVSPDKIDVIPIGADMDLFGGERDDSFRKEHNLENKFLAVFPGAHGVANGLDVLVETAALLPDHIRIIMIGEGGRKPHLIKQAQDLGTDKILFFDPIPKNELSKILTCMDVGLMILKPLKVFETVLPNKMFDLGSARLPIIVNFSGEVADQVQEKEAGIFVESSSAKDIAQALIKLSEKPELCQKMSQNARQLAQTFDRKIMASQFSQVINHVYEQNNKKGEKAS